MGDDIQNTKATAEDLAIEREEQLLADPSAVNMQFLQSTLVNREFDDLGGSTGFFNASAKQSIYSPSHSGSGFSGLSPAYSGAGLLGAVAAADMGGASSAMGIAAQVASAAPVTFGKEAVGESATLAALGDKALTQQTVDGNSTLLKPLTNADGSMVPLSAEFSQLLAMLGGNDSVNLEDALMGVLGQNPNAENLQLAIDAVLEQINLLNSTFEPVFDGLTGEVQSQLGVQNSLSSTDLGFSILDSADDVSTTLSDLLGSVDVVSNPQIDSLLSLGSTLDDVVSLVGALPELDLRPIAEPVLDVVDDVVDPILDPVLDPILDPITDVTDPVIDPIVDIITDITDPVTDPVTGVIDPILDPITDGGLLSGLSGTSSTSDTGLLDPLSSGISSNAGSEGGVLDGALGPLDSNK